MSEILLLCERGEKLKRLLSLVLVLLVLPWGGVFAQGGDEERVPVEHLLWDIPFGITVDECRELMKELTGLELDEDLDEKAERAPLIFFFSPKDELRLVDHGVYLGADFDYDGTLQGMYAEGSCRVPHEGCEEWEDFAAKLLQTTLEMAGRAGQDYGEAFAGSVNIYRSPYEEIQWGTGSSFALPILDGVPDEETLNDLFAEDIGYFIVAYYYDGVCFFVELSKRMKGDLGYDMGFFVSVASMTLENARRKQNISDELPEYSKPQEEEKKSSGVPN